jgi:hypothetical protein
LDWGSVSTKAFIHKDDKSTKEKKERRQCTSSVSLWRFCVTTVVMEAQQCLPFLLLTYNVVVNNVINIESIAMEEQRCVLRFAESPLIV